MQVQKDNSTLDPSIQLFWKFLPERKYGQKEARLLFPFKYQNQSPKEHPSKKEYSHLIFVPQDYMVDHRKIRRDMPFVRGVDDKKEDLNQSSEKTESSSKKKIKKRQKLNNFFDKLVLKKTTPPKLNKTLRKSA